MYFLNADLCLVKQPLVCHYYILLFLFQKVFVHILDMSKTGDVYRFAKSFSDEHDQLNVLVNNAGCMVNELKLVGDVEMNFATNTLGTYVLTQQLLPLLKKSENPRVVSRC